MGAFLDKPKTEKHNEHGCGNGLRYGVASMQGWRVEMEDAHCAVTGLGDELEDWSFFAVFDGHAGARVSAHCAGHLLECIVQTEEFRHDDIIKGIRSGFLHLDDRMRELPELASGKDKSGSTAVCALVSPRQVYVANCGDSRAVLCRSGQPVFATRDHKPVLPSEKERILRAGGSVMIQRVNGSLAVSRALGDYEYKNVEGRGPCEQLVSPEPEISVMDRDEEQDEFLVLACDGVWDVMSNEDLCDFVRSRLALTNDLENIANQVIDTCLYKGSRDNMSIVLVTFPGVPQPSTEAIQQEEELEAFIERRITEIVGQGDGVEFVHVLQTLSEEDIPGLPPGGGLSAKYFPPEQSMAHKYMADIRPDRLTTCQSEQKSMSKYYLIFCREVQQTSSEDWVSLMTTSQLIANKSLEMKIEETSFLKMSAAIVKRNFIESVYKKLCPNQADSKDISSPPLLPINKPFTSKEVRK